MSQQLEDLQKLAREYRAWLDAHPPVQAGRDAWLAKWKLWRRTQGDIDGVLLAVALGAEMSAERAAEASCPRCERIALRPDHYCPRDLGVEEEQRVTCNCCNGCEQECRILSPGSRPP